MLVIRLTRTGRRKYPTYRIVAADKRRAATGKFVSVLGNYNPHTKELVIKKEEIEDYLKKGAQPSNSVIRLLSKEKVQLPEWVKYHEKHKPSKQEPAEEPAKSEPAAETGPAADAEPAVAEGAPAAEAESEQTAEGSEEPKVAEEASAEAAAKEESVPDEDVTETAVMDEKQAEQALAGKEAAADAALEAAKEDSENKE